MILAQVVFFTETPVPWRERFDSRIDDEAGFWLTLAFAVIAAVAVFIVACARARKDHSSFGRRRGSRRPALLPSRRPAKEVRPFNPGW
ncbi:MAG TPA: hypothetical protein DCE44_16555 [Verrucomicrobiales bacterium]|nr:hypothetical protein [Verrucomicrobiales bacterium]